MPEAEIRAVIFDCDGTLVDSEKLSLQVLVDYVAEFGLKISHGEAMDRFAGNELAVVLNEVESRLGHALPAHFLDEFRTRQIAVLKECVKPCPGAGELLNDLSLARCVASNAPRNKIEVCLHAAGLRPFFDDDTIFSAYDIRRWKPAPDLFLTAARTMGVDPTHCAVIEDSRFGIEAGLAAGMQVFAYDPDCRLPKQAGVRMIRHLQDFASFVALP